MVSIDDVMSAKLMIQMGLIGKSRLRSLLQKMNEGDDGSVVNALEADGSLKPDSAKRVRNYISLYNYVRRESLYLKLLEKKKLVPTDVVRNVVALVESEWYKRRIGQLLVDNDRISKDDDSAIQSKVDRQLSQQNQKILNRYLAEKFKGVGNPLIPAKKVTKKSFRLSSIFRGRTTRSFVRSQLKQESSTLKDLEKALSAEPQVEESGFAEVWSLPEEFVIDFSAPEEHSASDSGIDISVVSGVSNNESTIATKEQFIAAFGKQSYDSKGDNQGQIGEFRILSGPFYRGVGEAYYRVQAKDGKSAILKTIDPRVADQLAIEKLELLQSTSTQLKAVSGLHHPIGFGREGQLRFIAIPEAYGYLLCQRMQFGGAMSVEEWLNLFTSVVEILVAAFETGVLLTTLTPQMLIFEQDLGKYQIIDFSTAQLASEKQLTALQRQHQAVQSYRPTGNLENSKALEVLCFSLGVMSFELLTGLKPHIFEHQSQGSLNEYLTLQQVRPDQNWPTNLQSLLDRLLGVQQNQIDSLETLKNTVETFRESARKDVDRDSREIVDEIFGDLLT